MALTWPPKLGTHCQQEAMHRLGAVRLSSEVEPNNLLSKQPLSSAVLSSSIKVH